MRQCCHNACMTVTGRYRARLGGLSGCGRGLQESGPIGSRVIVRLCRPEGFYRASTGQGRGRHHPWLPQAVYRASHTHTCYSDGGKGCLKSARLHARAGVIVCLCYAWILKKILKGAKKPYFAGFLAFYDVQTLHKTGGVRCTNSTN